MKLIASIPLLALATLVPTACKEDKQPMDIVAKIPQQPKKVNGPQKREASHWSQVVSWHGGKYTIRIDRVPDSTLVADATGQQFYDNRATLQIIRSDGSMFVDRTFRKRDFLKAAKGQYTNDGAFLGMVFDCVRDGLLVFGASIGDPSPDSDEFVPLSITVDAMGNVNISETSLGVEEGDEIYD